MSLKNTGLFLLSAIGAVLLAEKLFKEDSELRDNGKDKRALKTSKSKQVLDTFKVDTSEGAYKVEYLPAAKQQIDMEKQKAAVGTSTWDASRFQELLGIIRFEPLTTRAAQYPLTQKTKSSGSVVYERPLNETDTVKYEVDPVKRQIRILSVIGQSPYSVVFSQTAQAQLEEQIRLGRGSKIQEMVDIVSKNPLVSTNPGENFEKFINIKGPNGTTIYSRRIDLTDRFNYEVDSINKVIYVIRCKGHTRVGGF